MAAWTKIEYSKAIGIANPADLMTKELVCPDIDKYAHAIGASYPEGSLEIVARMVADEVQSEPEACDRPGDATQFAQGLVTMIHGGEDAKWLKPGSTKELST